MPLQLPELNALVAAGLKSGEVRPLPITVFKRDEIEEAFRYLAGGELPLPQPFSCSIMFLSNLPSWRFQYSPDIKSLLDFECLSG